jgi:hypothetical protein
MDSISGFSEDMEVVNSSYSIHLMHAVSNLHSAARVLYVALGLAGCVFFGVFLAGQGVSHAALWAMVLAVPLTAVGTIASVKAAAGNRAASRRRDLASGRRGRRFKSGHPDQVTRHMAHQGSVPRWH